MAPAPSDSPVRIPTDLLERAERLDPENRAEVVRRAVVLGIEELEREKTLRSAKDVKELVSEVLTSDPTLRSLVEKEVGKIAPPALDGKPILGRMSFYPVDRKGEDPHLYGERIPVFRVSADRPVEVIVPATNWLTYSPVDLRIYSFDPRARVSVSGLRADNGNGRDLLMPGWHRAHEFGGLATALAKRETIISPNNLRMQVTSDRDAAVSVSLVAQIETDSVTGPSQGPPRRAAPSGHLVRVPLEAEEAGSTTYRTKFVQWGVLKILGVVFEGDDLALFQTAFRDLKIEGSPYDLQMSSGFGSALDYRDLETDLRGTPVLIAPNTASVTLMDTSATVADALGGIPGVLEKGRVDPYLVCEVLRDDGR